MNNTYQKDLIVLGIETTCDETGAALFSQKKGILSNILSSSSSFHAKYKGVFPEHASRFHVDSIIPVIDEALCSAHLSPKDIDLISVAKGPGLIGSLLVGINTAKALSLAWNKPFIGVNHVEAHIYASMLGQKIPPLPSLGIVLSGGHTLLLLIKNIGDYECIGTTVDDAIGEAFDKAAAHLGLRYPGGPEIEKLALKGVPSISSLKAGHVKENPLNFSFSGLKTALFYALNKNLYRKEDLAASFQRAAFSDVFKKIEKALEKFPCKALFWGGGVSASKTLRKEAEKRFSPLPLFWPPPDLSTDNAAMIAAIGAIKYQKNPSPYSLKPQTKIPFFTRGKRFAKNSSPL